MIYHAVVIDTRALISGSASVASRRRKNCDTYANMHLKTKQHTAFKGLLNIEKVCIRMPWDVL